MPRLKLRFTTQAHRDLSEIFEFLSQPSPQAAKSVINAVDQAVSRLQEFPFSARETDMTGVRVKSLGRYPFLIFHSVDENYVTVLRIWHGAREWPELLGS